MRRRGLREVSPALDQEVMIDDITLAATASFEDNVNKISLRVFLLL